MGLSLRLVLDLRRRLAFQRGKKRLVDGVVLLLDENATTLSPFLDFVFSFRVRVRFRVEGRFLGFVLLTALRLMIPGFLSVSSLSKREREQAKEGA